MAPAVGDWAVKTDHWFYGLFQSAPDLITLLLPGAAAAPSLEPDGPGDALYRYEAPELKAANHRLDGVLWPRGNARGTTGPDSTQHGTQIMARPREPSRFVGQSNCQL